jgi:hypothetical protein
MASGINDTFRQLGLAIGIAGLGTIFQNQVRSHVTTLLAGTASAGRSAAVSSAIASGGAPQVIAQTPASGRAVVSHASAVAFSAGLSDIFLVASSVAFCGAVAALILVRPKDLTRGAGARAIVPASDAQGPATVART